MVKLASGDKYYIIASWTGKGKRVEECTWYNDWVDNLRVEQGRLFLTREEAKKCLEAN